MFKVYRDGIGYRISIGDHRPCKTRDLEEVKAALDHYYRGHFRVQPCPFCQDIAKREGRN